MYALAEMTGWILEHVVRYRRAVVETNLALCFPSWNTRELKAVRSASYRNLGIWLLESFKGNLFSDEELRRRFTMKNPELIQEAYDRGKDIILVAAHFNSWEWAILAFDQQLPYQTVGVYKPIKNKRINAYLDKRRTRTGMMLVPITETRTIREPHTGPPRLYIFVADQSPSNMDQAIWVDFLGRPTPCLHGPEKYARTLDVPVYFASIHRTRTGYYEAAYHEIAAEPKQLEYGEITRRFMKVLEEDIKRSPGSWLWSHKRWKRVKIETDHHSNTRS